MIEDVINDFDNRENKKFYEFEFYTALRKYISEKKINGAHPEILAFSICENHDLRLSFDEVYPVTECLKPTFYKIWINRKILTDEIFKYWEERANASINPILKCRYFGLLWEVRETAVGKKKDIKHAFGFVDSVLEIINGGFNSEHKIFSIPKLKHAVYLSNKLNSKTFLTEIKNSILSFYDKCVKIEEVRIWRELHQLLMSYKKLGISESEKRWLFGSAKRFLNQSVLIENSLDARDIAKNAFEILADQNLKEKSKEQILEDFYTLQQVYLREATNVKPFELYTLYDDLYALSIRYGLKNESFQLKKIIYEKSKELENSMITTSSSYTFDTTEFYNDLSQIFKGDNENLILSFIGSFIPSIDAQKDLLNELVRKNPLQFLLKKILLSNTINNPLAIKTLPPIDQDYNSRLVNQISNSMRIEDIQLQFFLDRAINEGKVNYEETIEYLKKSLIIPSENFELIECSLKHFFREEWVQFIYISIPQIENSIRTLCNKIGSEIWKEKKDNTRIFKNLDEILRDEKVCKTLGEDIATYFRILLTDPRGWNLRNNIFHGLIAISSLDETCAKRVFHALLILGLFARSEQSEKE